MQALRQSTHQHTHKRCYASAKHAADCFVYMIVNMSGCKGIDLQKPIVDTSPRPESPAMENVDDVHELRQVFTLSRARLRNPERWTAWSVHRLDGESIRDTASALKTGKSSVARWVKHVDSVVEQTLSERGMVFRSQARVSEERIVDVYEDGDGPARVCGGRSRVSVLRVEYEDV